MRISKRWIRDVWNRNRNNWQTRLYENDGRKTRYCGVARERYWAMAWIFCGPVEQRYVKLPTSTSE